MQQLNNEGALLGEWGSSQWLYDKFSDPKIVKSINALSKGTKELINLDTGEINIDPSHYQEVADILGISRDLLVSILDNARQFGGLSFSNIDEIAASIKESDDSIKGLNGKVFYSKQQFEEQGKAAGRSGKEIAELEKQLPDKGIILFDIKNVEDTIELIKENSSIFIPAGEKGVGGNTFQKDTVDYTELVKLVYESGGTIDDVGEYYRKFSKDGALFVDATGQVIKGNEDTFAQLAEDIIEQLELGDDPAVKQQELTNKKFDNALSKLDQLILLNGGTPEHGQEGNIEGANQVLSKAEENGKITSGQRLELKGYKLGIQDRIDDYERVLSDYNDGKVKLSNEQVEDINSKIRELKKNLDEIDKKEYKIDLINNIEKNKDDTLNRILNGNQKEQIFKIKTEYEKTGQMPPEFQTFLEKNGFEGTEIEHFLRFYITEEGGDLTLDEINKIEQAAEAYKNNDYTALLEANPDAAEEDIKEAHEKAMEYAEDKYESVLEADGSKAEASAAATKAYIEKLAEQDIYFNVALKGVTAVKNAASSLLSFIQKLFNNNSGKGSRQDAAGTPGRISPTYNTAANGKAPYIRNTGRTLTGELGPELVWSGDKAYLVGEEGPEMVTLKPRDTVYTAAETEKILEGKSDHLTFESKAYGDLDKLNGGGSSSNKNSSSSSKKTSSKKSSSSKSSSKSSSNSSNKIEEPPEGYDRLYNLLKRITKELRMINKYQAEYDRLVENSGKNTEDLLKSIEKQENKLNQIIINSQKLIQERYKDTRKLEKQRIKYTTENKNGDEIRKTSSHTLSYYATYDEANNITVLNLERLEKLRKSNPELYEAVKEQIDKLESMQDDVEDANDNIRDAKDALEELEDIGRDTYIEFLDRVYEAVIFREQEKIDALSQINDSINDSNQDLMNTIQDNISLARQERDNQETESSIEEQERRLAYLRRDTSNANALEIKQLEEEIATQKQDYTDTLIDQKISELQAQNDYAAEQRQQQIDLLQAQLDADEANGYFWDEVYNLVQEGTDEITGLVHGSELEALLKSAEGWEGLSQVAQMKWFEEAEQAIKEMLVWVTKNQNTAYGETTLKSEFKTGGVHEGDKITVQGPNSPYSGTVTEGGNLINYGKPNDNVYFLSSGDDLVKDENGKWSGTEDLNQRRRFTRNTTWNLRAKKNNKNELVTLKARANDNGILQVNNTEYHPVYMDKNTGFYYTAAAKKMIENNPKKFPNIKFKTGGLADFTGPAWLDGTKSKPELVLNQKDTQNFIALKNILGELLNGKYNFKDTNTGGDNYYEINIEVEKLESDYDVDKVADKVKRIITSDARYRNVNAINRLR